MDERTLRTVLLIQAVEQSDRAGELLPLADRAEATRTAARDEAKLRQALADQSLSPTTERFLAARADRLQERLELRSPIIRQVLALAAGTSWLSRALAVVAFLLGVSLSALDGSRRINILAFPLIGLIAWNFVVYILLIVDRFRSRSPGGARTGSGLGSFYERWIHWRAESLLKSAHRFNAPLTAALRRFVTEWSAVAPRLLILRAKHLFHLCAALVAVGLIVGIYVRGIGLRYEAGWESTFLGPTQVSVLLRLLYGPASFLSGIPLPASDAEINGLRWNGVSGGGEAAMWIHLLALTAFLYIIVPRLLASGSAIVSLWWQSRRVAAPPSLIPYLRETLAGVGEAIPQIASITPYAYEPEANSLQGLERLLAASLGGALTLDMRDPVRYGDEEAYLARQSRTAPARVANWNVLLMSLAATPEAENHGVIVANARDTLMRAPSGGLPLCVVIDAAPLVARMGSDPSMQKRIEDRQKLWREFIAGYGLKACLIDLSRFTAPEAVTEMDREAVRDALWTARDRAAVS
jgi:hypothetical protein